MHRLHHSLTALLGLLLTAALLAPSAAAKRGHGEGSSAEHADDRPRFEDRHRQNPNRPSLDEVETWWQGLPPEQRGRLHDRWQRFRDLPPEKQEKLRNRYQRWQELPPAERERLQRTWQRFRELPEARQKQLKQELRELRSLPEAEREQRRIELHRHYFPDLPPPPRRDRRP